MKEILIKKILKVYDDLMKTEGLKVDLIMDYDGLRIDYYKDIKSHIIKHGADSIIGLDKKDLEIINYNKEDFIKSILDLFYI